jgi:hypothetical protein
MEKLIQIYIDAMTSEWGIRLAVWVFPPLAIWKIIDLLS